MTQEQAKDVLKKLKVIAKRVNNAVYIAKRVNNAVYATQHYYDVDLSEMDRQLYDSVLAIKDYGKALLSDVDKIL